MAHGFCKKSESKVRITALIGWTSRESLLHRTVPARAAPGAASAITRAPGAPPGPAAGGGGPHRCAHRPTGVLAPGQPVLQAAEAPSLPASEALRLPGKARRNRWGKKSVKNTISPKSPGREESPTGYVFQSNSEKAKAMKGFHILRCHLSQCFPAHRLPQP